jgi:hypothetical protein
LAAAMPDLLGSVESGERKKSLAGYGRDSKAAVETINREFRHEDARH